MFRDFYFKSLGGQDNHTKEYLLAFLSQDYLFDKEGESYSLLIFLSFYEAYVKRMAGMAYIDYVKRKKALEDWPDEAWAEAVLDYAKRVKVPDAKSCYFMELQRWFKGDITEIVERLLLRTLPKEESEDYRQKRSLIEKKKLRSGGCTEIPGPPIDIPNPALTANFFLLEDSIYPNIITF